MFGLIIKRRECPSMQYESEVNIHDLKQEMFSMADIQELAITFLESLSHNVLRFNRKRETLDARMNFLSGAKISCPLSVL